MELAPKLPTGQEARKWFEEGKAVILSRKFRLPSAPVPIARFGTGGPHGRFGGPEDTQSGRSTRRRSGVRSWPATRRAASPATARRRSSSCPVRCRGVGRGARPRRRRGAAGAPPAVLIPAAERRIWLCVAPADVRRRVKRKSTLFTDEHQGYNGLRRHYRRNIFHSARQYVDGNVHTKGIESFWAPLKRAQGRTYHQILLSTCAGMVQRAAVLLRTVAGERHHMKRLAVTAMLCTASVRSSRLPLKKPARSSGVLSSC